MDMTQMRLRDLQWYLIVQMKIPTVSVPVVCFSEIACAASIDVLCVVLCVDLQIELC